MISPELLRRYPFFAGLTHDQLAVLAVTGEQISVAAGHLFFKEGDSLERFYLVTKGKVEIFIEVTDPSVEHKISDQITGEMKSIPVTISTVGAGEFFAWSAFLEPPTSTAGARAVDPATVVVFDVAAVFAAFEKDCSLGYHIMRRVGNIIRLRLRSTRVEVLACLMEQSKQPSTPA